MSLITEDNSLKKKISKFRNNDQERFATSGIHVTLKDFVNNNQSQFLSFFNDEDRKILTSSSDDLIFHCYKEDGEFFIDTGNYIGKIQWNLGRGKTFDFEIDSRFSNIFLQRMMNFANDIYFDDFEDEDKSGDSEKNVAQFVLHYLFVQALERAYLIGLPRVYQTVQHFDSSVKGRIDINEFIKKSIPFKGKIPSVSREQFDDPDIVDVLYKATSIATKYNPSLQSKIRHITPHLKQSKSFSHVSSKVIKKACKSKALNNPIFSQYKRVLGLAEKVINQQGIDVRGQSENGFGFLINVAELFEVYLTKLLQKEFPDWAVSSPKIEVYKSPLFFSRKIIPDIVMEKNGKILVFDAKYKRMNFRGRSHNGMGDVDRNDFFQIHTYMSYYMPNYDVVAAGLLYPISIEHDKDKCYSDTALGNDILFVIDGIDQLDKDLSNDNLLDSENRFIERIRSIVAGK